jgi:hypothetical protein
MVPGMINKDYFRRQARTLRKMVKVTQDDSVAERLRDMAEEFEARAVDNSRRDDSPGASLREGRG